jgi:hypothetical protein
MALLCSAGCGLKLTGGETSNVLLLGNQLESVVGAEAEYRSYIGAGLSGGNPWNLLVARCAVLTGLRRTFLMRGRR